MMQAQPTASIPSSFVPRPRAARRRTPSLVDVTLDPVQREAVTLPAGRALLVLGEAGHGKTTVALHRLANLWRASGGGMRAAVIVPTEGLARLMQPLLRRLGVDVEVLTYDRWAVAQARRAFRGLPRESELTPPGVMRLKRDPALRLALEELAAREPGRIDDDPDAPRRQTRANVTRGDLQHLFGDQELLGRVARASRAIRGRDVEDTLERTRVQMEPTTERAWAHVTDRARLVAVDGRALDDGTATAHADTFDVEDVAVLFELDRLRAARRGRPARAPRAYDLIVLDEAQELAPLELALLGRSLSPQGTLVVAGDADQQTDGTTAFLGWEATMGALGRADHATVKLDIGYRCPPPVVRLARHVLGGRGEDRQHTAEGQGTCEASDAADAQPAFLAFDDEPALASHLGRAMRALQRRDPRASIAVVCRSPMMARRLTARLQAETIPTRLVFDGRFLARGPVQVSTVDEVKGLEFDFVVVPDAGAREYAADAASRRALYVAVTRARHQVALAWVGERSVLLPASE